MKVQEAVFFTDNSVVRIETDEGKFYLTEKKKLYDMHPINVMAKEITGAKAKEVKECIKKDKFKDNDAVRKWV
jgi:hypothetical protein